MSRYLDPKADVVFKKIFGDHPHLLISFLNAVLPLTPDRQIVSLTYLPNEYIPKIPALKRTIADVRCIDKEGRVFIVEMQINWTDSFKNRLLFETSQAYVKQLEIGEEYHLLQPVYGLGLVNTIFDRESPEWYHHYQLVNVEKPVREIIEGLQLVFIELPKFEAHGASDDIRMLWLRFMREVNQKTMQVSPELLAIPAIHEAVDLSEQAAYTPGEMMAYEQYWDAVSIEKTFKHDAYTKGLSEGEARGRAEGEARGRAEGEAQGITTGIENTLRAIELLRSGQSIDAVSAKTSIARDVLEKLCLSIAKNAS